MSLFTEFRFEMFPSDCAGGSRRWAHLSSHDQTRVSRLQSPAARPPALTDVHTHTDTSPTVETHDFGRCV